MWTSRRKSKEALLAGYDREMLRSAFVSIFWAIITYKKEHGGFALKTLADKIGINKSAPTRWFSGQRPNWTADTIADIASALGVDVDIKARDRETGIVFTSHGPIRSNFRTTAPDIGALVLHTQRDDAPIPTGKEHNKSEPNFMSLVAAE